MKRTFAALLISGVVVAVGITVAPPQAAADSGVCVAAPDVSTACNNTSGSGGRVDSVEGVMWAKPYDVTVCGYSAQLRISAYGIQNYRVWNKAVNEATCSAGRSWLTFQVNETFPVGTSYSCLTNFRKNVQQGREICIQLTGATKSLGTFMWRSAYNGNCVDGDRSNTKDQTPALVQVWWCNSNAWQRWQRWSDGTIRSSYNGRCLDADLNTISGNGTRVQVWPCNGQTQQQWAIDSRDNRGWMISSAYSHRCIDGDGGGTRNQNGSVVQLWDCNANAWQRWETLYL